MRRERWLCLNGEWQFERDPGDSGLERGLLERPLCESIVVPFCPEAPLSGLGDPDFHQAVWYRREVEIPADWQGERVLLHVQACDYDSTVWIDGREAARHRGGFCPFTVDLGAVAGQRVAIVLRARDDHRDHKPSGKQAASFGNRGCHYTRTTGIWQTVWLEPVPACRLERPRLTPDLANSRFLLEQRVSGRQPGLRVAATLRYGDETVCTVESALGHDFCTSLLLPVPPDRQQLWEPGQGRLYDLEIHLLDEQGREIDRVDSYAGLRSVCIDGLAVCINGRSVFQRLVLDQGYYPDGIMTAPSEEALIADIELSLAAGFNGARLHQKVFEERFLYHADRLGYLVWGEFADWCGNSVTLRATPSNAAWVAQWAEAVERDYSHPAIIGWCPLNETRGELLDRVDALQDLTEAMYRLTKLADRSRPVFDVSGWMHRIPGADCYDHHDYEQDPERFAATCRDLEGLNQRKHAEVPWAGQPYMISEFGGTWWNAEKAQAAGQDIDASWGYGQRVRDVEEFHRRFAGLCSALLENPRIFGYCYTQLTDVFQEENGLFHFDRSAKFDLERLRAVQQAPAAIEIAPLPQ
jgi:beta-galactosidase/beta-glucuronidase